MSAKYLLTSLLSVFLFYTGNLYASLIDSGFRAEYEVMRNGIYLGTTTRHLTKTAPDTLTFTSYTKPEGLVALFVSDVVNETSILTRKGQQLVPTVYSYKQTGGKKNSFYKLKFDWEKQRLLSTYNNQQHSITTGAQELLSFQLQLMLDLISGKRNISYEIADRKGLNKYVLKNVGKETIETENESYKTIKLASESTRKKDRYIIWCAEGINFLPVKIKRIEADGDEIELLLKKLTL